MKKLIFGIVSLALVSCSGTEQKPTKEPVVLKPASELTFQSDPNLETVYIAFLLADYPLVSRHESRYKSDAQAYFANHHQHEAVKLIGALMHSGFSFDWAVNWIYTHTDFPEFQPSIEVDFPFGDRVVNADSLEMLRTALVDFYQSAHCADFFAQQKPNLEKMINQSTSLLSEKNPIDLIQQYFGQEVYRSFRVALSPLLHSGGYAVDRTGKKEMIATIGPNGSHDSIPTFDQAFLEYDLIIHEFSHNFANPVTDEFMDQLASLEPILYSRVKERAAEAGYGSWESYLRELMVRATTIRIVELNYGKEAAQEIMEYDNQSGFEYVSIITEMLKVYEREREEYPTFRDFFSEIVKGMKELKVRV